MKMTNFLVGFVVISLVISISIFSFSLGERVEYSEVKANSFDYEDYDLEGNGPVLPASYYGELTINGRPSPAGVNIVTMIEGEFTGNFTTYQPGSYGDEDEGIFLVVEGDSGDIGKEIDFYVKDYNGKLVEAEYTEPSNVEFGSGTIENVNLYFEGVEMDPSLPSLSDIEAEEVNHDSAVLSTSITYDGYSSGEITFFYKEGDNDDWKNTGYESISDTSYATEVKDLKTETTYEFYPYLEVDDNGEGADGTTGSIKQFTTLSEEYPKVSTEEATDITEKSAKLHASVEYGIEDSVDIRFRHREEGLEWDETSFETISSESYSKTIDGLSEDTTYEYYAQIRFNENEDEGVIEQFITDIEELEESEVFIQTATSITQQTAILNAEIDYNDFEAVDIQFSYRKVEDNEWKKTGFETITDDIYEYKVLNLESNTEYEYYATILFDDKRDESEKETFSTEKASPNIKEITASNITPDEASLEMSYELKDYDSAFLRFIWRRSEGDWSFTEWIEREESGLHAELLENLDSGEEYEYRGQIEYDSELLESEMMSFETSTEENQPPIAEFSWSPEEPEEGAEVVFDASESYDPDGEIEEYKWSFGDGEEGSGEITNHTYSEGGEYMVILEVVDDEAFSGQKSKMISISEVEPPKFLLSEISLDKEDVKVGDEVTVSITITNTGGSEGEYEAVLFLNEEELGNKTLKLESGSEEIVSFSLTMEEKGEQTISIGERSKTIQVEEVEKEDAIGGPYRWLLLLLALLLFLAIIGSIIIKKMK